MRAKYESEKTFNPITQMEEFVFDYYAKSLHFISTIIL